MKVEEALSQVAEIHRHLLRTEYYRGYRSPVMAVTGLVAFIGAAAQARFVAPGAGIDFVRYWLILAAANLLLVSLDVALDYYPRLSRSQQRVAASVVAQFIPSLVGGLLVTWGVAQAGAIALLPGLWCVLFSMGVLASRPYLPQGVGWVGLCYLTAGGVLLGLAPAGLATQPWGMGLSFGMGQLLLALVLYWNLERAGSHER